MKKVYEFLKGTLKKNFIAGTVVLVPIFLTVWILKIVVVWADTFLLSILPDQFQPRIIYGRHIPGIGILVTVVLILLTGILTRLYLGKKLVNIGDAIIAKIPIGRSIYMIIKEFLTGVLTRDKEKFKGVAVIEWPRKGCYMLGFITGEAKSLLPDEEAKNWVNLFVPTTPNPTSGFYIMLPEAEVKMLDMSVDSAFKLLITAGFFKQNRKELRTES